MASRQVDPMRGLGHHHVAPRDATGMQWLGLCVLCCRCPREQCGACSSLPDARACFSCLPARRANTGYFSPLICRCSDTTPAGRTGNERRHGGGHGAREQLLDGSRAEPAVVRNFWRATTPAEAAVSSAWCLRRLASRIRLCVELLVAHAAAFSTLFLA